MPSTSTPTLPLATPAPPMRCATHRYLSQASRCAYASLALRRYTQLFSDMPRLLQELEGRSPSVQVSKGERERSALRRELRRGKVGKGNERCHNSGPSSPSTGAYYAVHGLPVHLCFTGFTGHPESVVGRQQHRLRQQCRCNSRELQHPMGSRQRTRTGSCCCPHSQGGV